MLQYRRKAKTGFLILKTVTMNPQKFTATYLRTLQTDPETNQSHLKIPVTDLDELACIQQALLQAIQALAEVRRHNVEESQHATYWLCKLLLASYPGSELEGLAILLESYKH